DLREVGAMKGWRGVTGGRREAVRKHVSRDHEVLGGIYGFLWTDQEVVAMMIPRVERREQDGVTLRSIQGAMGDVRELGLGESHATFKGKVSQIEVLIIPPGVRRDATPQEHKGEGEHDDNTPVQTHHISC